MSELPEDVWRHILGLIPQEDLVFYNGLLNASKICRSYYAIAVLNDSCSTEQLPLVLSSAIQFGSADLWTSLARLRWPMAQYGGEVVSQALHAARVSSCRELFYQYASEIAEPPPFLRLNLSPGGI